MSDLKVHTLETWQKLSTEEKHEVEKRTLHAHLDRFGMEPAKVLLADVEAGRIDGSSYMNEGTGCGCILGTLAKGTGTYETLREIQWSLDNEAYFCDEGVEVVSYDVFEVEDGGDHLGDDDPGYTAAEVLAVRLRPGDSPENSDEARLIRDWTKEWIDAQGK